MSDNIKKLEKILDTLSNLYEDAAEVDSDSASAISVAEDTVINAIKYEKDMQLALSIRNQVLESE